MQTRVMAKVLGVAMAAIGVWATSACGRSNLLDYDTVTDGAADVVNPDGGSCGPGSCPTGCCDGAGKCRTGTDINACGGGGDSCEDCVANKFEACSPTLHACYSTQPSCDVTTCGNGCCTTIMGSPACVAGNSDPACGAGGQACVDCTTTGAVCDDGTHTCAAKTCDATTCPTGCCSGGVCHSGQPDDTACGTGGAACVVCPSSASCTSDGKCDGPPPICNATNCKGCCLSGTVCVVGTFDTECGMAGQKCADCTNTSQTCQGQACVNPSTTCNSTTCSAGCCQSNTCFAGFVDNRCGSAGNACADCTSSSETCDTGASPRDCTAMTTCPGSYAGCGGSVSTTALSVNTGACSSADLADAKAGCKGGFGTAGCDAFFSTIASTNPSCSSCLAPFDYSFNDGTGLFNCVSPLVASSCNHSTGCADDCADNSCSSCSSVNKPACETSVRGFGGQCQKYFQGAGPCVGAALFSKSGAFCSPFTYGGSYGDWLAGVGAHFCGP